MKWGTFLVWCCFVSRGLFYSSALPLWEGFDEWGHLGVIEKMRVSGSFTIDRNSLASEEIDASLLLAPVPRGMTNKPEGAKSHEEYWKLSSEERGARQAKLSSLPPTLAAVPSEDGRPAYEASQPPLYYALLALILKPFGGTSLLTRVWIARYVSVLIASIAIPISFRVFRLAWSEDNLALAGISVIAAAPAFVLNEARISNEVLSLVVFTLLLWAQLRALRDASARWAVILGAICGVGLLTKAYFLTAIPALVLICAYQVHASPDQRRVILRNLAVTMFLAFAIGGWWYLRNIFQTGTLSGLDEALILRELPISQRISGIFRVDWIHATASILLSHVWYGGWSLLALPRWIYFFSFAVMGLGVIGLMANLFRGSDRATSPFLAFYLLFWVGQLYQVLMLFLSKGSSTAMGGWYLHAVIAAEVVLLFAGIKHITPSVVQPWILPLLVLGLTSIDLYGLYNVSLPYYTQSPHLWVEALTRLVKNKPGFLTTAQLSWQWLGYTVSTICLVFIAALAGRQVTRIQNP